MQERVVLVVFLAVTCTPGAFAIVNPPFDDLLRGDANNDLRVDLSDPLTINNWLFSGSPQPVCLDAADANDDGAVNVSDSTYLYTFLFMGGFTPRQPFPACGPDPSADSLNCYSSSCW